MVERVRAPEAGQRQRVFKNEMGGLLIGVVAFRAVIVAKALWPSANESFKYFTICCLVWISSGPFICSLALTPGGGVWPRIAL